METILALVSNLFGAIKEVFGFQSKRLDLKNAQDVKDAAVRQAELDAVAKTEKAVAEKNTDELRKEIAE